jgi:ribosomal-protein-alanine N-acetyltransferase
MISAPESIQTERLLLRKPALSDAQAMFDSYTSDPEVTRTLLWNAHTDPAQTEGFLQRSEKMWQRGEAFAYSLQIAETDELIGMIVARMQGTTVDIGYVLAKRYWGQGYMSEAARAMVDWAMGLEDIFRVSAVCDIDNIGSARVMEKAGMQREGRLRRYMIHPHLSPEPRDVYMYAIAK